MKKRMGIVYLAAGCAIGIAIGVLAVQPRPQTVLAKAAVAAQAPQDGKLRIIIFGAHPDDPEYFGAGVAAKWAKLGHHVKLVATTNGDIGHWQIAGGPLAQRRRNEVMEVARRLGVTTQVLDIHDGEIMPTLENRRTIARLIQEWNADIVITNRPNDYHPDHRYTSILVQDAGYMVTVPFFNPDVPYLKKNPYFFYAADHFEKPNPFRPDVAIAIDDIIEPTLDALLVMESQIHEGGANGDASLFPAGNETVRQHRRSEVRKELAGRYSGYAGKYRDVLAKFYGADKAKAIRYAQTFEICEYGSRPSAEELKKLFPF